MTPSRATSLEWVLRIGACMCFVGHGAFGVMTKEAWVPYFAAVGIGRETAYILMPLIGALDITLGCLILVRPMSAALLWMMVWAVWTALLRPLSGESAWEAVERAGNYGVPAALLLLGAPVSWRTLFRKMQPRPLAPSDLRALRMVLQVTVAMLLVGHGALGVIGKHGLTVNYASVFPARAAEALTPLLGWMEIALAVLAFVRVPSLLLGVAAWKAATEALFIMAGLPLWEWMERGGSYATPVALAIVLVIERTDRRGPATSSS